MFWSVYSFVTLLLRWIYNGIILLIMTVQTVMDVSKFLSRRPRVNQKNKIHMRKFWGKQGKVNVWIPKIVDDYNRRFQPKTFPFSTHDIIWVNYQFISQRSQIIFLSFSYLNSARQISIIELCRELSYFLILRFYSKMTYSFVPIIFSDFSIIQISISISPQSSQFFG